MLRGADEPARLRPAARRCRRPATLDLDTPTGVQRALDALVESGVVSCFAEGPEAVYAIGPDQHLTAAYYRNTIIHFFVNGAIAELALLHAAERGGDRRGAFWDARDAAPRPAQVRVLLRREGRVPRRAARRAGAARPGLGGRARARAPDAIRAVLRRFQPFSAHRVLRPFLEAYRVVADALARREADDAVRRGARSSADCLALGKQYELQRRIRSAESVSKVLFATALALARNRGLLRPGRPTSPSAGARSRTRSRTPSAASTRSTRWSRRGTPA